ncbi:hypothetical protein C8J57DRAFT_1466986, partial [Mycena rebaudengoi]
PFSGTVSDFHAYVTPLYCALLLSFGLNFPPATKLLIFWARAVFAVFSAFFCPLAVSIILNTLYPISTKLLSCCPVQRSFVDPSNRFLICTTCTRTSILEFAHVVCSLYSLSTLL